MTPKAKRRVKWGLGTLGVWGAGLVGLYQYQPWRYDFVPRTLPNPNPPVDPDSSRLFAKGTRVTLITAHPDDAEFYLGGTLTKLKESGAVLSLVVCTDGDKAYYRGLWGEDAVRNRRVRRAEQTEAAKRWGATDVVYLGFPDARLPSEGPVVTRLVEQLQRLQPEYILGFDSQYPPRRSHGDHRRAGEATDAAVRQAGVGRWLLKYSTIAPNYVVDITGKWEAKKDLLRVHASQFKPERFAFIEGLVGGIARRDGQRIGVEMGEGLRAVKLGGR